MDQIPSEKAQEITSDELIEFFTEVGISPSCSACNKGRTAIIVNPDSKGVRQFAFESAQVQANGTLYINAGKSYPTVNTVCQNCGYLRTFASSRINAWLNEKHPGRG